MKRRILLFIMTFCVIAAMAGCASSSSSKESEALDSKRVLSIVTTVFPEYDWLVNLTNGVDNVDLTMLLDNGVDLHSYQPSAADMVKISKCDMFIYIGGESDEWVEDALKESVNKDMVVLNLLDVLGDMAKEEEAVEGMEDEEEEGEDEEEEIEYDEHIWLSLKNAIKLCDSITNGLVKMDSEHKDIYEKNNTEYANKLSALDKKYQEAVADAAVKTILFGDRFPFRYMVSDYGLDYYAAFKGCSAESEASFETITFLAGKVDELGLKIIVKTESSDGKIANTINENTKDKNKVVVTMNSMQSATSNEVKNGVTYLSIMEDNLVALKEAIK